jgi:hypothetical protein
MGTYNAKPGQSATEIAAELGISLNQLLQLNPGLSSKIMSPRTLNTPGPDSTGQSQAPDVQERTSTTVGGQTITQDTAPAETGIQTGPGNITTAPVSDGAIARAVPGTFTPNTVGSIYYSNANQYVTTAKAQGWTATQIVAGMRQSVNGYSETQMQTALLGAGFSAQEAQTALTSIPPGYTGAVGEGDRQRAYEAEVRAYIDGSAGRRIANNDPGLQTIRAKYGLPPSSTDPFEWNPTNGGFPIGGTYGTTPGGGYGAGGGTGLPGGGGLPGYGGVGGGGTIPGTGAPSQFTLDSARQILTETLSAYNLEGLTDWAYNLFVNGATIDEIMIQLRQTPEFKEEFWVIGARQEAGMSPVSPNDVIAYRQQVADLMSRSNVPSGFVDKGLIDGLLGADVSAIEVSERLLNSYSQVANVSPEIREAFEEFFGPNTDDALASWFLDPEIAAPVLERQANMATFGGTAIKFGFDPSDIGLERAGRAVDAGVSVQQASQAFTQLNVREALFNETITEGEDLTATGAGVDAALGLGGDAAARLRKREQDRAVTFGGRGGFETSDEGVVGLR